MKIRIVEEDYIHFLFDFFDTDFLKNKLIYPYKTPGFNMSFSKFYNNKYIFAIRIVIPFSTLLTYNKNKHINNNPIIQGITPRKAPENNIFKETFNNNNYSHTTIWDWFNTYESTIFFVGDFDIENLKINFDRKIEPFVLYRSHYFFPIEEKFNKKIRPSQHYYPQEDFRLFFENNICYTFDSYVNQIKIITFENNILNIETKYDHVCNYRFTKNNLIKKNEFKKIFEKNWSLYNIIYEDNIKQIRSYSVNSIKKKEKIKIKQKIINIQNQTNNKIEKCFQFIHDFSIDGLYGVDYYPSSQKCYKKLLVSYPKNKIPLNLNNDYCRFSIGSTTTKYEENKYIGVGHVKVNIKRIKEDKLKKFNRNNLKQIQSIYNEHFFNISKKIHKELKEKYGKIYRPHHQYIYGIYYFIYDSKNQKFIMSDIFLPLPEYKYVFSLSFPMSIIEDKNYYIISSGYGDYTNILIRYEKDELIELIKYDISEFDPLELKFNYL